MNTLLDPVAMAMPDVQSGPDTRRIAIQRVGVRGVRHPLLVASAAGQPQATIADWEMTVALPADEKGTHMSRFIALLESRRGEPMTPAALCALAQSMLDLLHADAGDVAAGFPYFIEKPAPVSGVRSLMDYQVRWSVRARRGEAPRFSLSAQVPVTSLCPCSKAISEYGAHNQRSHVTVDLEYDAPQAVDLDALIRGVESQASSELWGLLKRADEKFVTERAYENPKFVEDLVRDVAVMLRRLPGVASYQVTAENFESIHNHSAYAVVRSD
ncbi:GTP cyclohydrolase FolE2 OS=Castellaniella defragrans (strain DSM / CCUG 39792 / 65Phen) OX=1437824 GN=folE2 PE=3 SV=1 [Castellaniella denitrificans]|jgi:GTP cyclohydrolase I|uniref:GTP cyclohydrolase FolE2 n=1 Tax=Castellaniella denitrificans TaxID=56119 RepID=UPI001AC5414E|nr:GTP cyclohydrolase I FolE2 [Burkholderiales bacterium]